MENWTGFDDEKKNHTKLISSSYKWNCAGKKVTTTLAISQYKLLFQIKIIFFLISHRFKTNNKKRMHRRFHFVRTNFNDRPYCHMVRTIWILKRANGAHLSNRDIHQLFPMFRFIWLYHLKFMLSILWNTNRSLIIP